MDMSISNTQLRGKLLSARPSNIVRCGLSRAQFAADNRTNQWYGLSMDGHIIGAPTEFDFYRPFDGERPKVTSDLKEQALATSMQRSRLPQAVQFRASVLRKPEAVI